MARVFIDKAGKRHFLRGSPEEGFDATVIDYFEDLHRGPQIITQKDIGLILAFTGVSAGWRVVEAGSGSGALTLFLANAVRHGGKVYSYEQRKEHLVIARKNVDAAGLGEAVEFKLQDVYGGINEENVDLVVFDLPEPQKAVKHATTALKCGGFLACYIPTMEQLSATVEAIDKARAFTKPKALESITREFKVEKGVTRPESSGITHTGYLVFARKL